MSNGYLIGILGDMHIPYKEAEINKVFKNMLQPDRMQKILVTGNLCTKFEYDYLRQVAPNVHVVKGDMDENEDLPESLVVTVGAFRIGLIHGHQIIPWGDQESLNILARQMDVDILVSGHTHKRATYKLHKDGPLFVNPGSITGASSTFSDEEITPSFMCMSIFGNQVTNFVYELDKDGKLKIHKTEYTKPGCSTEEEEEEKNVTTTNEPDN